MLNLLGVKTGPTILKEKRLVIIAKPRRPGAKGDIDDDYYEIIAAPGQPPLPNYTKYELKEHESGTDGWETLFVRQKIAIWVYVNVAAPGSDLKTFLKHEYVQYHKKDGFDTNTWDQDKIKIPSKFDPISLALLTHNPPTSVKMSDLPRPDPPRRRSSALQQEAAKRRNSAQRLAAKTDKK